MTGPFLTDAVSETRFVYPPGPAGNRFARAMPLPAGLPIVAFPAELRAFHNFGPAVLLERSLVLGKPFGFFPVSEIAGIYKPKLIEVFSTPRGLNSVTPPRYVV